MQRLLSFLLTASGLMNPVFGQEQMKTDSVEISSDHTQEEEVFIGIIEEQPVPESGYEEFMKKITREIKFPEGFTKKGRVFIRFTVDTTGKMQDIEILKGFNELADKEALRVMTTVDERFKPSRQSGKLVRIKMAIPINFDPEIGKKKKK